MIGAAAAQLRPPASPPASAAGARRLIFRTRAAGRVLRGPAPSHHPAHPPVAFQNQPAGPQGVLLELLRRGGEDDPAVLPRLPEVAPREQRKLAPQALDVPGLGVQPDAVVLRILR